MLPNPPSRLSFERDPDAIAADMRKRLEQARYSVEQAAGKGGKQLIPALELIEEDIGRRFTPLRHLNSVASTPEVRKAYEQVLAALTDYETWLGQHQGLYEAFKALADKPDFVRRPRAEQALVRHALLGFRLSGADLPVAKRDEVRERIAELSELGNRYEMNVLDATDAWRLSVRNEKKLRGLPEATVELLAERAREKKESGWLLTLDPGVVFDVLRHADDRALREAVHGAWVSRASDAGPDAERFDNVPVIEGILAGRRRLARVLGYPDYAGYALETRMAASAAWARRTTATTLTLISASSPSIACTTCHSGVWGIAVWRPKQYRPSATMTGAAPAVNRSVRTTRS